MTAVQPSPHHAALVRFYRRLARRRPLANRNLAMYEGLEEFGRGDDSPSVADHVLAFYAAR
jgi:hypothetical protein